LNICVTAEPLEGYALIGDRKDTHSDCDGAEGYFEQGANVTLRFENMHSIRNLDITGIAIKSVYDPDFVGKPYRSGQHNPKGAVEESYDIRLAGPQIVIDWRAKDQGHHKAQLTNMFKFEAGGLPDRNIKLEPNQSSVVSLRLEGLERGLYTVRMVITASARSGTIVKKPNEIRFFYQGN